MGIARFRVFVAASLHYPASRSNRDEVFITGVLIYTGKMYRYNEGNGQGEDSRNGVNRANEGSTVTLM